MPRHGGSLRTHALIALLVGVSGCASILGLEEWTDPPLSSTGGGGAAAGGGGEASGGDATTTSTTTTSGVASGGPGSCADGAVTLGETDVDCGGDACPPCAIGLLCANDADCESGHCDAGTCGQPVAAPCDDPGSGPTCHDCIQDGDESDVDCGGDACPPCALELNCHSDADCESGHCDAGVCVDPAAPPCDDLESGPTCHDCVQDGDESDVDCGGEVCLPCGAGRTCAGDGDCLSGLCQVTTCVAGAAGTSCQVASDCASGQCAPGSCALGTCCL